MTEIICLSCSLHPSLCVCGVEPPKKTRRVGLDLEAKRAYDTAEEASKVYEKKAIELFGDFKR